ncbi:MAG: hypothetical protein K8U03_09605 [Planctomycetia bacterium]|nr:hypothetical protein [Planctomycetia bacterium]
MGFFSASQPAARPQPHDEFSAAIEQIERELDAAFAELDGWARPVLDRNRGRLGELRSALVVEAERICKLDALATQNPSPSAADERRRARGDLLGTFAWIRELVSMIHLAKLAGAPASRAEELVAQIAAAVESISIVADARREQRVDSEGERGTLVPR